MRDITSKVIAHGEGWTLHQLTEWASTEKWWGTDRQPVATWGAISTGFGKWDLTRGDAQRIAECDDVKTAHEVIADIIADRRIPID